MALALGEAILIIGRLLGLRNQETALKCAHLSDAMVREAADVVGAAVGS